MSSELEAIRKLAEGARLLITAARHDALPLELDDVVALASAEAIIAHVAARLRNLQRALSGALDPAFIWSEVNGALPPHPANAPDVRLDEWSTVRNVARANALAARSPATHQRNRRSREK